MRTLLNMFSKHYVDVLVDLLNERSQDQVCVRSLERVQHSVSRRGFVADGYNPCLQNYVADGTFFCDNAKLRNQAQRVLFGPILGRAKECKIVLSAWPMTVRRNLCSG